jgi:hypothetical protein
MSLVESLEKDPTKLNFKGKPVLIAWQTKSKPIFWAKFGKALLSLANKWVGKNNKVELNFFLLTQPRIAQLHINMSVSKASLLFDQANTNSEACKQYILVQVGKLKHRLTHCNRLSFE